MFAIGYQSGAIGWLFRCEARTPQHRLATRQGNHQSEIKLRSSGLKEPCQPRMIMIPQRRSAPLRMPAAKYSIFHGHRDGAIGGPPANSRLTMQTAGHDIDELSRASERTAVDPREVVR